jgi:hypothetical protein
MRLISGEKYAGEEFEAAVTRMNRNPHAESGKSPDPAELGEVWDAS